MLNALFELLINGDYISWWNTVGIAEDHALIDALLTLTGR